MTLQGTTLIAVKQQLVTLLTARPGLSGVTVTYAYPTPTPTTGDNIWFAHASASTDVATMAFDQLDETIILDCRLQVLKTQSEGQQSADVRCVALLVELQNLLATNPMLGLNSIELAEVAGWNHIVGALEGSPGNGSAFDVKIRIKAILE